jgi:hypothetical protein
MVPLIAVGLARTAARKGYQELAYYTVEWAFQLLACAVLFCESGYLTPQSVKDVPDLHIPVLWCVRHELPVWPVEYTKRTAFTA